MCCPYQKQKEIIPDLYLYESIFSVSFPSLHFTALFYHAFQVKKLKEKPSGSSLGNTCWPPAGTYVHRRSRGLRCRKLNQYRACFRISKQSFNSTNFSSRGICRKKMEIIRQLKWQQSLSLQSLYAIITCTCLYLYTSRSCSLTLFLVWKENTTHNNHVLQ